MNTQNLNMEDDLDFFRKKTTAPKVEPKKFQFEKFKNVAIGVFAAVAITGVSVGGYYGWQTHQKNKVQEIELSIKQSNPEAILSLIENEKTIIEKTYLTNKLLFNQYGQNKEIVEILNLQKSIGKKIKDNDDVYSFSLEHLSKDAKKIEKVINATKPGVDYETKKEILLNDFKIDKFNEWKTLVGSDQYMYAGQILKVEKEIKDNLQFIEDTKKEIVETVHQKIKNKDYNLNATQAALSNKVASDLNSEINELQQVKEELKGTEQANILTDNDLNEAKEAIGGLQSEAINQIAHDKATVESMIASVANEKPQAPNNQNQSVAPATSPAPAQTVYVSNNNSNRWGFFEYYLLYNWLAGGSSNSPSAMATYTPSRTYSNPVQGSLHSYSASRYDIKNSNSYINKKLSTKFGNGNDTSMGANKFNGFNKLDKARNITSRKFDIVKLREKIQNTREKAIFAKKERKAEVARKAEIARKVEVAKAESARTKSYSSSSRTTTTFKSSRSSRRR